MRPIAFLIVVHVLFLLTQPCQDVLGAPSSVTGEVSIGQGAREGDCENGNDGCSPFCICSCRQAPAGYVTIGTAPEPKITVAPTHSSELEYECRTLSASISSIWQPPKY